MTSLVIGRHFEGGPVVKGVITAHFKIAGAFRSRVESDRVVWLCRGPLEVYFGERNLLNIRWSKQPAVIHMKDIGPVQLVCHPDAGAELSFIIETLNEISSQAKVQRE